MVLLLTLRVALEYIKAILRLTEIYVELPGTLMVSAKILTIYLSFSPFKLLDNHMEIPMILKTSCRTGKKYWQIQFFTANHGMNSLIGVYYYKPKRCRKYLLNLFLATSFYIVFFIILMHTS